MRGMVRGIGCSCKGYVLGYELVIYGILFAV